MEAAVYVLCATTAFVCSLLLWRRYRRQRIALLLWCALFFLALTLENLVLFVDLVLLPQTDLSLLRNSVALLGVLVLLYGLIWETN